MKIHNQTLSLSIESGRRPLLPALGTALQAAIPDNSYPLRFSIVDIHDSIYDVEASMLHYAADSVYAETLADIEILHPRRKQHQTQPFCAVQVIPTGIRCNFGGYAGDACPVTNLLAASVDVLITHPNAVNASEINEMANNVLYVEGKSLDDFLLGHVNLLPAIGNRIGTVVDPTGINYMDHVINTLNAARAAGGIDCARHLVLDDELGIHIESSSRGCAAGTISNIPSLLKGVEALLNNGAQAIGCVSVIHGATAELFQKHLDGLEPNPSGGVEAIITHLISKLFRIPAAHAPLPYYQEMKAQDTRNPRASAEFISIPHYFCVLKGLHRAPRLIDVDQSPPSAISINNIGAVVVPAGALGGIPAIAAEYHNIPLIAVYENDCILNVTPEKLPMRNIIEVETYLEAAGVLLALKQGISLESLRRPIHTTGSETDISR